MPSVITVAKLNVPVIADTTGFSEGLEKAEGLASSFAKNIKKVGTLALGVAGGAVTAVAGIGAAVGKMAFDAAPVENLMASFQGLAEGAGVGMDEMLTALQKGSSGMIAQRDLMQSFNEAATLVSTDFAKQLPDAMQFLGKVSAATGKDMDYLLSSLVTGVGRLSPQILDNLAIQVSLEEAVQRAAEMFGVEAEDLTKTQQQAGMMSIAMEKLAATTADMPDVSESAAAKMERLKATFQDTKDQIGLAFLPILNTFMGVGADLAARLLPFLIKALDAIGPTITLVSQAFSAFFNKLFAGADPIESLRVLLRTLVPEEVFDTIMAIVEAISKFVGKAKKVLAPIIKWIGKNVKLQDILVALGIALATVIIPAIIGVVSSIAPVVGAVVGLIAIIAGLRAAWENDFLGIRTALTEAWNTVILPALQQLWQWLQVNIPAAIAALNVFWTEVLLPAIQSVWAWVTENLFPLFGMLVSWLQINIPIAIEALKAFWTGTLLPAIQAVWAWISGTLIPGFQVLVAWLQTNVPIAIEALRSFWTDTLLPAIQTVWTWIEGTLIPGFQTLVSWLQINIPLAIAALKTFWEETLLPAIQAVWTWIEGTLIPGFQTLVSWLQINIPLAIAALKAFWEETLLPAIQAVWTWIEGTLIPGFETVVAWLQETIPVAIETLKTFWEETLLPAMEAVWAWIQDYLVPLFETVGELLGVTLTLVLTALAGLWENVLLPAIQAVGNWISETLVPAFEAIRDAIVDWLQPKLEWLAGFLDTDVKPAFEGIGNAITNVTGWIQGLIDKIKNLELPDWLTPGSPTPFELGLRGIAKAAKEVARVALPDMTVALQVKSPPGMFQDMAMRPMAAMQQGVDRSQNVTNYNTLNVNTRATTGTYLQDYHTVAALQA